MNGEYDCQNVRYNMSTAVLVGLSSDDETIWRLKMQDCSYGGVISE